MSNGPLATIHYGTQTYNTSPEIAENLIDVLSGLELLGGSHLFGFGGTDGEPRVRLFITPGTPVAVHFAPGYETPEDRKDYVLTHLEMEARFRLGLTESETPASA